MKNRMSKGFPSSPALNSLVNIIFICAFLCISVYGEQDNNTKLFEAAKAGNTVLLKQLIDANADVNTKKDGVSALMIAVMVGKIEAMKLLIAAKADVNAKCTNKEINGWTPLIFAIMEDQIEAMKLLIAANADVNVKFTLQGVNGYTPLMLAADWGKTEGVKLLIGAKADVNAKASNGFTALAFAAGQGHVEATKALLDAGATITFLSKECPEQTRVLIDNAKNSEKAAREKKKTQFLASLKGVEKAAAEVIMRNLDKVNKMAGAFLGSENIGEVNIVDIFLVENKLTGYYEGYFVKEETGQEADANKAALARLNEAFGGAIDVKDVTQQKIRIRVRYNGTRCVVEAFDVGREGNNMTWY